MRSIKHPASSNSTRRAKQQAPSDVHEQCVQLHELAGDHMKASQPKEYYVLLQNLPKPMLKEDMLRSLMKEAKLHDINKLAFRADGKVLVTLTTYDSLCRC